MSQHPYPENLSLARQLLAWSQSIPLGVEPSAVTRARDLALDLLRPLACSLEAGHVEALWEICAFAPDEGERRAALIEAAAWGHTDAMESVRMSGDASLVSAVERLRHRFEHDGE